jgi:hypothetical protein
LAGRRDDLEYFVHELFAGEVIRWHLRSPLSRILPQAAHW